MNAARRCAEEIARGGSRGSQASTQTSHGNHWPQQGKEIVGDGNKSEASKEQWPDKKATDTDWLLTPFFAADPDFKISKSLLLLSEQCPWSCLTNIFLFSTCFSNLRFLVSVSFHKQPLFSNRYIFFCCSWQKLTTNSLTIIALQLYVVVMSLQTISKCFSVHILAKLNNWGPMQAIVSVLPLHPNQVVVWVFLRHLWTESRTNDYWQVNLSIEPMNP